MSYVDGQQQQQQQPLPQTHHHRRDNSYRASCPDYDKGSGMRAAYDDPDPHSYTAAGAARPAAPNGLGADEHLPPPPIGETLKPALKRAGSRSRLQPDDKPSFPDEASYLGGRAPDLEAKTRPRDQRFRDLRDGYESDEGEVHRVRATKEKAASGSRRMPRPRDDDAQGYDDRRRRSRRGGSDYPPPDSAISSRGGGRDYDDPPPPRRSRRDPYDDDHPPRRRGDRPPPGVEYGAEPVPSRVKSDRRPRRRDYDDYSDDDDDRRPRRPRSVDNSRRRPRDYDDGPYYSDEPRRRRDEYDPPERRRNRSRRRDDDYDDYDDRRDRDRRGSKPPKEIKIGKYDIGPWVEKGQKHWTTVAPIVTPFIMNYVRKNMGGGGRR